MVGIVPGVGLVVAGGGRGRRFGSNRNKLLVDLNGLPLFCHCLRNLAPIVRPRNIVLVAPAELQSEFHRALVEAGLPEVIRVIPGGNTRQESVLLGIEALPPDVKVVAIQDAARPHTSARLLAACIESAKVRGSGVAARVVTDTVKIVDTEGRVLDTPDRATLRAAETPQVFRRDLIVRAYRHVAENGLSVTDDARAVELLQEPVYLVEHADRNPKITYPDDIEDIRSR